MTALGDARGALVDALRTSGLAVHDGSTQTAAPPCLVVIPSSPWIDPRGLVRLDVLAIATSANGWTALEPLVEQVRQSLRAAGIPFGDTDPPQSDETAGAISCRTEVSLRVNC